MDAPQWNGDDDRPMGSSKGQPEPWKCLDCPAEGKGYVSRGKHWYETGRGHHIVTGCDPRAKTAPRAMREAS
jgi:hypothetical protein